MQNKKGAFFIIIIIKAFCFFTSGLASKENSTNSILEGNYAENSSIYEDNSDNVLSLENETEKILHTETDILMHNLLKLYSDENEDDNNTYSSDEFDFTETKVVIEELKIIEFCSNSLVIWWRVDNENVSTYLIEWYDNDNLLVGSENRSFPDSSDNMFKYTISNLTACRDYRIQVTSQPVDESESKEVNGTTAKIQPSAPSILTADPILYSGEISLNVSWDKPSIGQSCIKYYDISLSTEIHGSKNLLQECTPSTNIIIRRLFPCTSYLVTVKAIDHDEGTGLSSTFQASPTFEAPSGAPKLNIFPPFTSTGTTITLYWNVLDLKNNCTVESVFTECNFHYAHGGYGFDKYDGKTYNTVNSKNSTVVQAVVNNLSPFSKYNCRARIRNKSGQTSGNSEVCIDTKELAPSPPPEFDIIDGSELTFSWQPPATMPGKLQEYKITFSWEPLYPVPDGCDTLRRRVVRHRFDDFVNNTYTWHGEDGYSNCTAHIAARTGGGWSSNSPPINFHNGINGLPSSVQNLTCKIRPRVNDTNVLETILTWKLPCSLRGRLKHFAVSVFGRKKNLENHVISSFVNIRPDFKNNDVFSLNLGELKPEYSYTYEVAAINHNTHKRGAIAKLFAEYPAAIPPQPPDYYLKIITLSPENTKPTTTSVEILLPVFSNAHGDVKYYSVMVLRLGAKYEPAHTRFDLKSNIWPNVSTWRESMEEGFLIPYQATEPKWTPYPNYVINYGSIKAVKFTVGDDSRCKDVSLTTKCQLYCNGPLKPDTWYEIRMRAFTTGGYADSPPVIVKTAAEVNVALIIGIVIGILLLGITVALLLSVKLHINCKKKDFDEQENHDSPRYSSRQVMTNINPQAYDASTMRSRRH